jgi:hypothetical protein
MADKKMPDPKMTTPLSVQSKKNFVELKPEEHYYQTSKIEKYLVG